MAQSSKITNEDLELEEPEEPEKTTLKEAREKTDRELILRVLTENSFNVAQSAADLGISRPTLYELMEKLGIKK
jgi:two-component system NtrC family response regulator